MIGKDGILKAIEDGDIEASDLLDDFLAEDSDQATPVEAMSQEDFSSQDQFSSILRGEHNVIFTHPLCVG
ncbi:hypothetical protein V470_11020 [Streptococcus sp. VT 162]|nr:hypothetical protein V470_11020 [Streptococcus sp. VT 162]